MPLNCKAGDLAVVIGDEPGCEANIGRIVRVLEHATFVDEAGHWWVIEPTGAPVWMCFSPSRGHAAEVFSALSRIAIDDCALRPIRGLNQDSCTRTDIDASESIQQTLEN